MSDDDAWGDEVYQPDPTEEEQDDVGLLDPEDSLLDRGVDQALDEGYSPPERPRGVEHYGITADEQQRGESLDQRLAEEVPDDNQATEQDDDPGDDDGYVGDRRSGRLLSPGEGAHEEHDGMVGTDVGIDGSAASAEEAAVHITPDGG
ncbi:hypothetical protein GXW83_14205 [Streptacidiphilus sp. PB12-B1b]|uniref:DUF5709 domain-containing protein n=1 Tax=Streptacidiphilus sp. PB12-B1b TaxID=2705012 RepID=UPI0015F96FA0|nr:DUF5709 domain-containing protein [Streptacidiphilus sp. PB12-B1b]QMU76720.1 hypothetical protein GXW83_14205 [Streptacidiphilus sp. PB12-B1b]